ncbi:flagellar motor protein MotB [Pseudomonas sp. 148P]|uniref:Flagellar motor protein MotB n=1 Tax=Pseudomonas ulcerans TaxID=3115852 RepID=A0ABU7HJI1_9PSED|nr:MULTISPECIES: flagellar motor protein MotB [unclassified Pseudomonas]MEE1921405.1 flagellar motor protein MotB [Pseudomonas sp. 147P]MEE1931688.1 flagellar motor protein MotB [Pseudomonas sp. 148P]
MSEQPLIIRRKKKGGHGHHGGAWKIAFADFMTALMALFLVLWVLSNAGKGDKEAIAEYFSTPLLVAMSKGDKNTASTSAIPGGGTVPSLSEGEMARKARRPSHLSSEERKHLQALKQRLESAVEHDPKLRELKQQIAIELSPEGLRVQLLDTDKRPMFELGSARVAPYMSQLLRTFAPVLNELPNQIQISGHTDSHPYAGGEAYYSNWDLSADRAKASRQELVAGGLDAAKLLRVSGMSDRIRFRGAAPFDAVNRRIEIIVLDSQVAERILNQEEFGTGQSGQ